MGVAGVARRIHFLRAEAGHLTRKTVRTAVGSRRAGEPSAYRALYERLRTGILSGQLPAGTRLPSSRGLAEETGLSRNTVLAAFDQLQSEGYVAGRRGSGTYVAQLLPEHLGTAAPYRRAPQEAPPPAATLSARGERLAQASRVPLPSVLGQEPKGTSFLIGLPALDAFPIRLWSQLYEHRLSLSWRELAAYGDAAGYRPLREAVAAYIAPARGIHCTADQVVITTGSQQAIRMCAQILLDHGDNAWVEDPGYLGARGALVAAGARICPVPVDDAGLDVAAGVRIEPTAQLAVVTPSHQFPLGHTMSLERRLQLIEWARSNRSWILEDDYDAEFRYAGRPHSALFAIDTDQRVVYVGTFSKALFPGLRLGYMIAPPSLIDGFVATHLSVDIHAHTVDQAVVADFIEQGHFARHVRRMRVLYKERQTVLVAEAVRTGCLDVAESDGGLHLAAWLPEGIDDQVVARRALRRGVHVWPLSIHYLAEAPRRGAILLGYAGTPKADVTFGMGVLRDLLCGDLETSGCPPEPDI